MRGYKKYRHIIDIKGVRLSPRAENQSEFDEGKGNGIKKEFASIIDGMEENRKTAKKRHYDTKIPCPSCGERIGIVQPDCPFCEEAIPFWSDKAGKILLSLGCLLASGYLAAMIYFWEDNGYLLGQLLKGFGWMALAVASAAGASRY